MTHVLPEITARLANHVARIGWDDLPADVLPKQQPRQY